MHVHVGTLQWSPLRLSDKITNVQLFNEACPSSFFVLLCTSERRTFASYDPTVVDRETFPAPEDAESTVAETESPKEGEASAVHRGATEEDTGAS